MLIMCVHVVITDEEANAALIGSTVGVATFLVIAGIIFFSILFGVRTYRKKEKMAMYVVDDFKGYVYGRGQLNA